MKPFESFIGPQLEAFLEYRHKMGWDTKTSRSHLRIFDQYLKKREADWNSITPSFFLEMRNDLNMSPRSVNHVINVARGFFKFLQRREDVDHNPLRDIPSLKENATVPFIFSPEKTDLLLEAAHKRIRRKERHFLTDLGVYMAILLLARCGMRISEPLRLRRHHYRSDDGTLYIEKTKFKKKRLIPAPKVVMKEMDNYLSVRKSLLPHDDENPYLLADIEHRPLKDYKVRSAFHRAVEDIGLKQARKVLGNMIFNSPVPHSLRHSFAINTLRHIKERGESPKDALHILAAYLGHREYHYTSVYLKVVNAKSRKNLLDYTFWQEWKRK